MAITTPQLSNVLPFASTQSQDFKITYSGSNQKTQSNLVIQKNSDNSIVYDQTIQSFSLTYTLPANILVKSFEYRAKIRVGDINNEWSNFSDWIYFCVLSTPSIVIPTIDINHKVYNSTINFQANYVQLENELLQSYKFLLYGSNQNLIQTYAEKFADGSQPLEQEITGLENGELNYLEVKTISVHGQLGTSGLLPFTAFFITPRLITTLNVENLSNQGAIKLSVQLIQEIGQIDSGTIEFIDNDWVDLTNGQISFQDGFQLGSDFILKLWCKNIPDSIVFLKLVSEYGSIEVIKYGDEIHAFKYLNGLTTVIPHFISNTLTVNIDEEFMVYLQSLNNALEITQQLV